MSIIAMPPRNNIAAAVKVYKAVKDRDGVVSEDRMEVLMMLQDDPEGLLEAIHKLEADKDASGNG